MTFEVHGDGDAEWNGAVDQPEPRRALAARADYEHRAYMRGDVAVGVHGAYPPAC